jgi:hypothetical protein
LATFSYGKIHFTADIIDSPLQSGQYLFLLSTETGADGCRWSPKVGAILKKSVD